MRENWINYKFKLKQNHIELDHRCKITLSSCVAIINRNNLMLKMITSLSHFNGFLSQITLHWTNRKRKRKRKKSPRELYSIYFFSLSFSINWLNLLPLGPVINLLSIMFLSANEFYIQTCTQSQWSFDIVFFICIFKYLQTDCKVQMQLNKNGD